MSKLIIVVVPDSFIMDNVVARIKHTLPKEGVHVLEADSYQAVKELDQKSQHPRSVKTLGVSGNGDKHIVAQSEES